MDNKEKAEIMASSYIEGYSSALDVFSKLIEEQKKDNSMFKTDLEAKLLKVLNGDDELPKVSEK